MKKHLPVFIALVLTIFLFIALCPKSHGQTKEARKIIAIHTYERIAKRDSSKVEVEHYEDYGDPTDSTSAMQPVTLHYKLVDSSVVRTIFDAKNLEPVYDSVPPPPSEAAKIIWQTPQSKIKVLLLGDGFTQADSAKYWSYLSSFVSGLTGISPVSNYKNYFQFDAKLFYSLESGISNPTTACYTGGVTIPVKTVINRYKTTANYGGTCRLFVSVNKTQIAADAGTGYDYIIILVNTDYYGGSGGQYPVASMNAQSIEIMRHELWGHRFAGMGDEYTGIYCNGGTYPNIATDSLNAVLKFGSYSLFTKPYKGANYSSTCYWRAFPDCEMNHLGKAFCAVCSTGIVNKIKLLAHITDTIPTQPPTDTCKFTATASWLSPYCTLTINTTRPYSTFKFSQRVQKLPTQYDASGNMLYSSWVVSGVEFVSQTSSTLTVRIKMRWCWTSTTSCYKQQVLIHKNNCNANDLIFTSP